MKSRARIPGERSGVGQLVEQSAVNRCVAGSSPAARATFVATPMQIKRRCPRGGADRYHWIEQGVARCECGHERRFRLAP